jgi:hypothetical protein
MSCRVLFTVAYSVLSFYCVCDNILQLHELMCRIMVCLLYPTRINGLGFDCPNSRWQFEVRAPGLHPALSPVWGATPRAQCVTA